MCPGVPTKVPSFFSKLRLAAGTSKKEGKGLKLKRSWPEAKIRVVLQAFMVDCEKVTRKLNRAVGHTWLCKVM